MKRIGIALDNLGPNQLAHGIITSATQFLGGAGETVDIVVFIKNLVKPVRQPNFAVMNMAEAFDYTGTYIATDLDTALCSLKYVGPRQRYFYVWDLEWLFPEHRTSFSLLKSIYTNPELPLIARSETHAKLIEIAWNRKVAGIVEDGHIDQLYKVID